MRSTGKSEVVVVTGASAGLGRAIVRKFARDGASVGLLARVQSRIDKGRKEGRRPCRGYCITGALMNFAIFALTLPEAREAFASMVEKSSSRISARPGANMIDS